MPQLELEHLTDEQIDDVLGELTASVTHSRGKGRVGQGVEDCRESGRGWSRCRNSISVGTVIK